MFALQWSVDQPSFTSLWVLFAASCKHKLEIEWRSSSHQEKEKVITVIGGILGYRRAYILSHHRCAGSGRRTGCAYECVAFGVGDGPSSPSAPPPPPQGLGLIKLTSENSSSRRCSMRGSCTSVSRNCSVTLRIPKRKRLRVQELDIVPPRGVTESPNITQHLKFIPQLLKIFLAAN